MMKTNKFIDKISKNDLNNFILVLKRLNFVFDSSVFLDIVENTLKYLNTPKEKRVKYRGLQYLENKWYDSLKTNKPNYSIYDNVYYLADTWICWKKYSRQYLKNIISCKVIGKNIYIKDYLKVKSIIDLGCGIGYSTAALKEMFKCKVIGTNLKNTKQYKICEFISKSINIEITDKISNVGKIDLVFASEYFEHFERPLEHLNEILKILTPKYILFANTFNSKSIGHFDTYKDYNKVYTGKEISKEFTKTLKSNNYIKIKTNCFNNRPNLYQYAE